jgi:hypothetical protein
MPTSRSALEPQIYYDNQQRFYLSHGVSQQRWVPQDLCIDISCKCPKRYLFFSEKPIWENSFELYQPAKFTEVSFNRDSPKRTASAGTCVDSRSSVSPSLSPRTFAALGQFQRFRPQVLTMTWF